MKDIKKKSAALIAVALVTLTLGGCSKIDGEYAEEPTKILNAEVLPEEPHEEETGHEHIPEEPQEQTGETAFIPAVKTVSYIKAKSGGVNIRSGAGAGYSSLGTTENATLYAYIGKVGDWYKTYYKNRTAYISAKYCDIVEMTASDSEEIEKIIAEGTKLLGTPYVYGATRYHNGNGKLLSGFKVSEFDCSSLMQYMFKLGAGINIQVNTRTQIYQGRTVKRSELKRGDLMFFTNASRKNNTGIERVGHVAMYLGDNLILHTASDYAKIEQISSTRWGYFIQGQRII